MQFSILQDKKLNYLGSITFILLLLMWLPGLFTPYWQDDYHFLYAASHAQVLSEPWYQVFFNKVQAIFWRPLSKDLYWYLIVKYLYSSALLAHCLNYMIFLMSVAAVGWLCAVFVRCCLGHSNTLQAAILGALVYGIHSSHLLPIAWVSAVNDSMLVLFSVLSIGFAIQSFGNIRRATFSALFLLLALLVKENAVVVVLFSMCLSFWYFQSIKSWYMSSKTVLILQSMVILSWLAYRYWIIIPVEDSTAYSFALGDNLFRNLGSLLLFLLNMPREGLRLFFLEQNMIYLLWGSGAVLLSFISLIFVIKKSRNFLNKRQLSMLAVMFLAGIALFVPISWNCYAYYLSLALIPYTFLYVVVLNRLSSKFTILSCLFIASVISLCISFLSGMPAIIARSYWVEKNISRISKTISKHNFLDILYVKILDADTFTAIGDEYGLAYRLQIPVRNIVVVGDNENFITGYKPLLYVKKYQLAFAEK